MHEWPDGAEASAVFGMRSTYSELALEQRPSTKSPGALSARQPL